MSKVCKAAKNSDCAQVRLILKCDFKDIRFHTQKPRHGVFKCPPPSARDPGIKKNLQQTCCNNSSSSSSPTAAAIPQQTPPCLATIYSIGAIMHSARVAATECESMCVCVCWSNSCCMLLINHAFAAVAAATALPAAALNGQLLIDGKCTTLV